MACGNEIKSAEYLNVTKDQVILDGMDIFQDDKIYWAQIGKEWIWDL